MTNQEIFNTVWNGLAAQGFERSVDKHGACRYRGDNGRKCAAGWLIPDDVYTSELEGLCSDSPSLIRLFNSIGLGGQYRLDLISRLQAVHDTQTNPGAVEAGLRAVSTNWGLEVPSQPSLPL